MNGMICAHEFMGSGGFVHKAHRKACDATQSPKNLTSSKRHPKSERNELCPKMHVVWGACRYHNAIEHDRGQACMVARNAIITIAHTHLAASGIYDGQRAAR